MHPWYVYLVRCADGTLYCGITTDVKRRLAEHDAGTGAKYTRSRGPVRLEVVAECPDKSAALKLELAVKRQPASRKLAYLAAAEAAAEVSAPSPADAASPEDGEETS